MIILIVYFEYMIGSFSFFLKGQMVDLPQRTEILTQLATIKCNATTGEEYCESTGKWNSMVELLTSTGRDLDLRSN